MRLLLGHQNLIKDNGTIPSSLPGSMEIITGTESYGITVAPDGSSTAYGFYPNSTTQWRGIRTKDKVLPADGYIYLWSLYVKPTSDHSIRTVLYLRNKGDDADSFGYNVHFQNKKVISAIDNPWASSQDSLNYGYVPLDNDWFYFYMACDCRYLTSADVSAVFYINAPTPEDISEGCYVWRPVLERSVRRSFPSPGELTETEYIDGSDFPSIEFTQLPSNIEEIENDLYKSYYTVSGELKRSTTAVDKSKKTLVWEYVNYQKHGAMIYGLREALRDKLESDASLYYPDGFKSKIRCALIRVVDFRFEYQVAPHMARVEVDYYITNIFR